MDTQSNIDTVTLGYEETANPSGQPRISHTPEQRQSNPPTVVQDALSVAASLQQLRTQRLDSDPIAGGM